MHNTKLFKQKDGHRCYGRNSQTRHNKDLKVVEFGGLEFKETRVIKTGDI